MNMLSRVKGAWWLKTQTEVERMEKQMERSGEANAFAYFCSAVSSPGSEPENNVESPAKGHCTYLHIATMRPILRSLKRRQECSTEQGTKQNG